MAMRTIATVACALATSVAAACSSPPTVKRSYVGAPSERLLATRPVDPFAVVVYPSTSAQPSGDFVEPIAWIEATYTDDDDRVETLRMIFDMASRHHANALLAWSETREYRGRTPLAVLAWAPPPMPRRDELPESSVPIQTGQDAAIISGVAAAAATVAIIRSNESPLARGTIRACAARIFEPEP